MNIDKSIFKAYDIRGVYPEQLNEELAYKIAQAYAKFIGPKRVVLGRDARLSGPALFEAALKGLVDHGVDVLDIGMVTTDMMYFAVVHSKADGGLCITASHNPKEYNGLKMVRVQAGPISGDSGIYDIRNLVIAGYSHMAEKKGGVETLEIFDAYIHKVMEAVDASRIKPFKIVANINFGAAGRNVKEVAEKLNLKMTWLNFEPNGEFPKGRPDPLVPENRSETMTLVKSAGADFGVAWDADADRCFFFDETGRFLPGYFTTAVLAEHLLKMHGPSKVLVDSKLNWATIELVKSMGGEALTTKTGHSFYKEVMRKEGAIFGGEVSAHYYFKDFYSLDNGLLPFLYILQILSETGKKLSEVYEPYFDKYFPIDETNFKVADVNGVLAELKSKYSDGKLSELDGVAIEYSDWRFSVRSSNTEPIIRLNLEARSEEVKTEKTKELSEIINRYK